VTNAFGFAISASANLFVMNTNDYTQIVRAGSPIAYWRLDETNGSIAYDAVGQHNGFYINANLNQPGFSAATGSDLAITVPANASQKGYMVISNASPDFSFTTFPFTLEAWAYSTNFAAKQRLISTLTNWCWRLRFPSSQPKPQSPHTWRVDMPFGTASAADLVPLVITCDGNTASL
jgi:hypothetical protein